MIGTESKDESVRGQQAMNEQEACPEVPKKNLECLTLIIPPKERKAYMTRLGQARRKPRIEARLVTIAGANRGAIVWLDKDEILIGREAICEVCLSDEAVSRKQCAVKADNESFRIMDFGSRNGTFVNGVPIREKFLQHGDKIRIGGTELVFLDNDEAATPPPVEEKVLELTHAIPYSGSKELVREANIPNKIAPCPAPKPVPVQIPVPAASAALTDASPIDGSASLSQFIKIIRRQRWKIMAFVAIAILAAVAFQFFVPKVYEATATVKVERHTAGGVVGQEASQVSSVDDMDQIIATEIELALSDPVLRPVVERYKLLPVKSKNPSVDLDRSFFKILSRSISSGKYATAAPEQNGAAPIVLHSLKVTRVPSSYLMRISYRAHDPKLAADVANAVAQSLSEHANDTGKSSYEKLSALVSQDMSELHLKMQASAKQLAEYEKELNMVDPEQRVTILSARLGQLNTDLTAAQDERIRREAILAQVGNSNTLASAQAAQAAAQDPLLSEALQRLNVARQQFTSVRSYYAEGHPEYVKAQKQVQEVEAQVNELKGRAKERSAADYEQALGREKRLFSILQQTKAEADSLKARTYQYEQLKGEAENDKKIYDDLATRTRLAGINQQFQNATVLLAAQALAPHEPVFPKLLINVPVAVILSSILGVLIAVLASLFSNSFADGEEAASQLRLDVLAEIPYTKALSSVFPEKGLLAEDSARSAKLNAAYREAIRKLRATLNGVSSYRPIRNLVITSAVPGEGKSTTAAQLALAYAQTGKRVLLVDANFHRPAVDSIFKVASPVGFADVLKGTASCGDAIIRSPHPGLFLMPVGRMSRTAADLISTRASAVLASLLGYGNFDCATQLDFDLVIVDAPPVLAASEAQELAGVADGVLLLTKAGETDAKEVTDAISVLSRARANVVGLVLNQVKSQDAADSHASYHLEMTGSYMLPRLNA
ncbi:MAG: polysaccharide biosynthesis tyrosine autokinase [Acidobacteria bacterium]|nr:polysaccharide biosynthesis tyrosine autokinase [Acidobacteriaceae bacterium]MBV9340758.1 polysaccharide biosynthesis tyrosine autokinase [Acidobacteriota bacterium]